MQEKIRKGYAEIMLGTNKNGYINGYRKRLMNLERSMIYTKRHRYR